jgi:hypothetical protein
MKTHVVDAATQLNALLALTAENEVVENELPRSRATRYRP